MRKKACNLSMDTRVLEFAEQVMALRGQGNLTAFVEELIRNEYERRTGPLMLPPPAAPATPRAKSRPPAASARAPRGGKAGGRLDI